MNKNALLARFAGSTALIAPEFSDRVSAMLANVDTHKLIENTVMGSDFWPQPGSWLASFRPYNVRNRILHIPVKGVLLHDFPYAFSSFATGYEYLWEAVKRGVEDSDVEAIAFIVDSPGGEVSGCFDLVDFIYSLRGAKSMRAFAMEGAYSAAYAVASAADKIVVARTGGVGSIGVVTNHVDVSKMLEDDGYKITFIYAGKHKVDGNPYQPLPSDVKDRIQARIDETYGVFVSTVARNRGLDEGAVRSTEALSFSADAAVLNRLADSIGAFENALAAFADELVTADVGDNETGDDEMTQKPNEQAAAAPAVDVAAVEASAKKTGADEAKARMVGIMGLDEAKNRNAAAWNLASNTNMTVAEAKSLLATLPETKPEPASTEGNAGNLFERAMSGDNPELGASAPKGGNGDDDKASAILRNAGYR